MSETLNAEFSFGQRLSVRRKLSKRVIVAAICASTMLAGCQTMTNQEVGTAVGVVAGGLVGSLFGDGAGRVLASALGAAVGGLIGNQIGSLLDEQQREKIAETSIKALNGPDKGKTVNWNDNKGAKAKVTTGTTRKETKPVVVVRDSRVAAPKGLEIVGGEYSVVRPAPVRLAPSAEGQIVTALKPGEGVHVVGLVEGKRYALVAKNGKSIGYVDGASVTPRVATAGAQAGLRKAVDLDAGSGAVEKSAKQQGWDLDGGDVVVDKVVASVPCRDVTTQVTVKDKQETTNTTACRAPDGAWEL